MAEEGGGGGGGGGGLMAGLLVVSRGRCWVEGDENGGAAGFGE